MKTLFIEKGMVTEQQDIYAERIVVNGTLKVSGKLQGKQICGKGTIDAGFIIADEISCPIIHADEIVAGAIVADKILARKITAHSDIYAKTYLGADSVSATKITAANTGITAMVVDEFISLKPKNYSILQMIFSSWLHSTINSSKNEKADDDEDYIEVDADVEKLINEYSNLKKLGYNVSLHAAMGMEEAEETAIEDVFSEAV